jgi:putative methionine-R-sulfoxide reductase with GAF domain
MAIDAGEKPPMDVASLAPEEKELFLHVVSSCIDAIHKTNPIQQAANMEAFFASTCRQSLFYAGLYVREYRRLQKETFDLD